MGIVSKQVQEPDSQIALSSPKNAWRQIVAPYQKPAVSHALWQLANTLLPYALIWYAIHLVLSRSFWLALPLAILGGAFLVRIFIIFHDCGHGSFFPSRKANAVVGFITGVLTFSPFRQWAREHAIHHATSSDLARRGTGDVWTMTVQEYLQASRWKRFAYRLARNPLILFTVAPIFLFVIKHRFSGPVAGPRERRSVMWTNLSLLLLATGMGLWLGFKTWIALQLVMILVSGAAGMWLFYVQHQFEDVHWQHGADWNYTEAALKGSSFYKLPKILQWFSGNIGFHHIHHLSPAIPNYHLEKCHKSEPLFQTVKPLTLFASRKCLTFRLWDERRQQLVGFRGLKPASLPRGRRLSR